MHRASAQRLVAVRGLDLRSAIEACPTASVLKFDWAQLLKITISLPDGSVGSTYRSTSARTQKCSASASPTFTDAGRFQLTTNSRTACAGIGWVGGLGSEFHGPGAVAATDTETVRMGLEALIRHAAYERLRALRGTDPAARDVPRRRERLSRRISAWPTGFNGKTLSRYVDAPI